MNNLIMMIFLAVTCVLLCVCLALLLLNQPKFVDKEGFRLDQEQDAGSVPSMLVKEVALRLLGEQDAEAGHKHALPPSVRLERSWTRTDGTVSWQVFVCHADRCDVDFGTRCERVRIEFRPLTRSWHIASREDVSDPTPRPSSDLLLLPGPDGI